MRDVLRMIHFLIRWYHHRWSLLFWYRPIRTHHLVYTDTHVCFESVSALVQTYVTKYAARFRAPSHVLKILASAPCAWLDTHPSYRADCEMFDSLATIAGFEGLWTRAGTRTERRNKGSELWYSPYL